MDTIRDTLTTSPKALESCWGNVYLGQLLLLLIETTRGSFLPKVDNLYELNKICNFSSLGIAEQ